MAWWPPAAAWCWRRPTGAICASLAGSFFLSAPVEVLAARLRRNPLEAQRPSLTGKSLDDEVREVLEARLPLYRDAAHHELDARQSITELCRAVRTLLRH